MPLMRFSVLTDKVRNHTKVQTIRKPRKNPLKLGQRLHIHVQEKLGEAMIAKIVRKKLKDLTLADAQNDGFDNVIQCQYVIMEMHNCNLDEEFDIITYIPYFRPTIVEEL